MNRIYLPSVGSHEWQWLLASPGLHWKRGASAMALADAWEHAEGFPPAVAASLATDAELAGLTMLLGLPEHEVPLEGGSRASQTDLFVLARAAAGDLVTIAVEGKAREPFGDHSVSQWRAGNGDGRETRLAQLVDLLGLDDDDRLKSIRYQLLHHTASAVLEARRFGAPHAVMLVHSFSSGQDWFEDFEAFAGLFGAGVSTGSTAPVRQLEGVRLHLGWASDTPRPLDAGPRLGPRFDRAFALAHELHSDQVRKGTDIPYISHLMAVAALVIEDGGSEDEAIAALLHDAVEDRGGQPTLARIRRLFGYRVADIVHACSDSDVIPKPPWRERKEAYIAHLRDPDLPDGAVRVSLADKLHNARAILGDYLVLGDELWGRFNAGIDEQLWYYQSLADTFADIGKSRMVGELRRTVQELTTSARAGT